MACAEQVLGYGHPLARASRLVHQFAVQLAATIAFAVVAAVLLHGHARVALIVIAAPVILILGVALLVSWQTCRDRALDVIIERGEDVAVAEVASVRQKLRASTWRNTLARSLERTLTAAQNWSTTPAMSRPIVNVRHVEQVADEIVEVARLLRSERVPGLRGVALVQRLLSRGVASPLYGGGADELRRELGRIRFELARGPR